MSKQGYYKYLMIGVILIGVMTTAISVQEASAAVVPFDSGSTCVDVGAPTCRGAFSTATSTIVTLPDDGILDYTTFTVNPSHVVTFTRNGANSPVMIRTTGTVTILGTINVSASASATNAGAAGDGNLGDDGQPGLGGPGGYNGGFGGYSTLFGGGSGASGGAGMGPGGGQRGVNVCNGYGSGGGGGSFGVAGATSGALYYCGATMGGQAGTTYGQTTLLPLIGGSGGGGGAAGPTYSGAGGGGGGGAILISAGTASSPATIYMGAAGRIYADGGAGGNSAGSGSGGGGGGGSGGAIRLVANKLDKAAGALIQALGGAIGNNSTSGYGDGAGGGVGIVRIEANVNTTWIAGNCNPTCNIGLPGHVLVPNNPTLIISSVTPSVGGPVPVPANPTGNADITFPVGTTTVTVNVEATNIPRGATVRIDVVPASGAARTFATCPALAGASDALTTTSTNVTLSPGNNVLLASTTYSVTEIIALNLPTFDDGVRVAKIRVESTMGGESKVTYITASGKEYPADSPNRDKPKV